MKKHIALLLVLVLLLSACTTASPDSSNSSSETTSTLLESQNGTTSTTEGSTATEGSGETSGTETTMGTENTEGTEGTDSTTGSTKPTQGSTVTTTPTTEPPTTEPPATEPPVTESPVTEPPVTEPPVTEPPVTEQPTEPTTPSTPAPTTLTINTKSDTTITVGSTLQIDYTYSGNKSELTWTSSDTSVLTVNSNGVVTGIAAGNSLIKVTNGEITDRIYIIVEDAKPLATSLEMNGFNAPLYDGVVKYAGDYMTLRVWTLPVESNRNITVTSSNNSVVSVSWQKDSSNKNNITLNFKSAGSATVTIASADGAVSKSYSITVKGDYACNPGSGQLAPETWANCCTQVMVENGLTKNTSCGSYRVLTLSASELTFAKAKSVGQSLAHEWWLTGCRACWISYEGTNENGDYVFHLRWG